ncbi:CNNM domain-containing protein [Feifania hominis]|uniref:CNNM transmembrane domain-containing protein n=1 Tax=Feifania hominis TaxID=2763660 RepID=A0A926HU41_9FIRM|nr:CNNM domain-containing protein [Feifania hominis]MBC8535550.1 hypothetical protein [Feifania hominis]
MNIKWVITTITLTFTLSVVFYLISDSVLPLLSVVSSFVVLLVFIFIGIFFDLIGTAVQTADERPFHSMSARKVDAAREAVSLIRNAEKVANVCNDVIGDISGIISGSTGAIIISFLIASNPGLNSIVVGTVLTSLVAAVTVGGKAVGKTIAINNANTIIYAVARVISLFKKIFRVSR